MFKCDICGKEFDSKNALNGHIAKHKQVKYDKPKKCPYCNFTSVSERGLKRHITKNHVEELKKIELEKNKDNKCKCEFCNKYFANLAGLNNHRKRKHGATDLIKLNNNPSRINTDFVRKDIDAELIDDGRIIENRDYVVCQICGKHLKAINERHCSSHNITTKEYKEKFSNSRMKCTRTCYQALKTAYTNNLEKYGVENTLRLEDTVIKAQLNACKTNEPNSLERLIIDLNIKGLKFVGNGNFWINCSDKPRIPDFILEPIEKTNKIVEIFGDYWHDKWKTGMEKDDHEKHVIQMYKEKNYDCLVIWEHEIRNNSIEFIKDKITSFLNK